MQTDILFYPAIATIAALYASVGHGGASGYLAIMSLYGYSPQAAAPSALLLNLFVAAVAFTAYWRAGHLRMRLFWPFAVTSIPMAYLGARFTVAPAVYSAMLACALTWAATRLLRNPSREKIPQDHFTMPPQATALTCGAGIGLVSGMVGVGGGIFLSPLLILRRWADTKQTAAVSALFIWANSASGLLGHYSRQSAAAFDLWPLAVAAVVGGAAGSWLGTERLQSPALKKILGVVLLIAAIKSVLKIWT
ncbi:MAG: sulfite exporter TauE/SafE family protein [Elusimicrobiota bacterium]